MTAVSDTEKGNSRRADNEWLNFLCEGNSFAVTSSDTEFPRVPAVRSWSYAASTVSKQIPAPSAMTCMHWGFSQHSQSKWP
jgi:hypothetical protein